MKQCQRGMILIELLAVFVIIGIVASISVPVLFQLIEKSREDAFVSNALMMHKAANLHMGVDNKSSKVLTLRQLSSEAYIIGIIDPFTKERINEDRSYVRILEGTDFYICLKGPTKQICGEDGNFGTLTSEITRSSIRDISNE